MKYKLHAALASVALTAALLFPTRASGQFRDLLSLASDSFPIDTAGASGSVASGPTGLDFGPMVALGDTVWGAFNQPIDLSLDSPHLQTVLYLKVDIVGSNPNLPLTLALYDSKYDFLNYRGTTSEYRSFGGQKYLRLTIADAFSPAILSNVHGVQLTWDGSNSSGTVELSAKAVSVPTSSSVDSGWIWRAPLVDGNSFNSAAISPGPGPQTIVAVGEAGTIATRHPNGEWSYYRTEWGGTVNDVLWAKGWFVAGCLGPDGKPLLLRSANGEDWVQTPAPTEVAIEDFAGWAAGDDGKIIALQYEGTTQVSLDGATTWAAGPSLPAPEEPVGLTWNTGYYAIETNGKGTWVAVGTGGVIATSSDNGLTWTKQRIATAGDFNFVHTDGDTFVAMAANDLASLPDGTVTDFSFWSAFRSSDGVSWARTLADVPQLEDESLDWVYGADGIYLAFVHGVRRDATGFEEWGQFAYLSENGGASWMPVSVNVGSHHDLDLSLSNKLIRTDSGTVFFFGWAGLIASITPPSDLVELISSPYLGRSPPVLYSVTGGGGKFLAVDLQDRSSIYSSDGINFNRLNSSDYWNSPQTVGIIGNGFIGARVGLITTENSSEPGIFIDSSAHGSWWTPLPGVSPLPIPPEQHASTDVVAVTGDSSGRIVVLSVARGWDAQNYRDTYAFRLHVWSGSQWAEVTDPDVDLALIGPDLWTSVRPHLQSGSGGFLLLTPNGKLLRSSNGLAWTLLPPLPQDTAQFIAGNYPWYSRDVVGLPNLVNSFAVDTAGRIVARSSKVARTRQASGLVDSVVTEGPDRFFVLQPNAQSWTAIQPPASKIDRYEGSNVVWNGSIFASANNAGFLWTSPDGLSWTRRALGADVKVLTWTGQQFVGLTEYSSIITHPNGLSPVMPGIVFRLIKSINGVNLGSTDAGYAIRNNNGNPIQITNAGTNATASTVPGWTPVGAVASGSGYALYWKHNTNGQFALWTLNAQGAATAGRGATLSEVLVAETNAGTDLDGDGKVGVQFTANKQIGNVTLGSTQFGYAIRNNNGNPIQITNAGTNATASTVPGWTPVGAVASGSGYALYWKHNTNGQFALWTLNAQGAATAGRGATLSEVLVAETNAGTDLDGDGKVGVQFTANKQIGNVTLGSTQFGYAIRNNNGNPIQITNAGTNATASTVPGWTPVGAVASGSGYELFWRHQDGRYAQWFLNSTGAATAGGLLSAGQRRSSEIRLNYDINEDGIVGSGIPGIYTGTFTNPSSGSGFGGYFAFIARENGTGAAIAWDPYSGIVQGFNDIPIEAGGSSSEAIFNYGGISGFLSRNTASLNGNFSWGGALTGFRNPDDGPYAATSGAYQGRFDGASRGNAYAIASSYGEFYFFTIEDGSNETGGGSGFLNALTNSFTTTIYGEEGPIEVTATLDVNTRTISGAYFRDGQKLGNIYLTLQPD